MPRISRIVTKEAAPALGEPIHTSRGGGFVNAALPEPAYTRMMAMMHKAAWTAFVQKHARPR